MNKKRTIPQCALNVGELSWRGYGITSQSGAIPAAGRRGSHYGRVRRDWLVPQLLHHYLSGGRAACRLSDGPECLARRRPPVLLHCL